MQTTTFSAPDIVCDGCARAIKKSLGKLAGVADVAVDITAKNVTVTHEAQVSRETLITALDRAGFPIAVSGFSDFTGKNILTVRPFE